MSVKCKISSCVKYTSCVKYRLNLSFFSAAAKAV